MLLNPHCQAAAHAELDAVVGRGRLPDYDDRKNLPYINAIVTEVLRWNPVTPMGEIVGFLPAIFYLVLPFSRRRRC
jgi:cytochrome P450